MGLKEEVGLLDFLQEQYTEYKKNILPLVPELYPPEGDDYGTFDAAKNEFLESVWDVIQQHFDDAGKPTYTQAEMLTALQHWFTFHANHFDDFDTDTNAELLECSNETEPILKANNL